MTLFSGNFSTENQEILVRFSEILSFSFQFSLKLIMNWDFASHIRSPLWRSWIRTFSHSEWSFLFWLCFPLLCFLHECFLQNEWYVNAVMLMHSCYFSCYFSAFLFSQNANAMLSLLLSFQPRGEFLHLQLETELEESVHLKLRSCRTSKFCFSFHFCLAKRHLQIAVRLLSTVRKITNTKSNNMWQQERNSKRLKSAERERTPRQSFAHGLNPLVQMLFCFFLLASRFVKMDYSWNCRNG